MMQQTRHGDRCGYSLNFLSISRSQKMSKRKTQDILTYEIVPRGVCSRLIEFEVEQGSIQTVTFSGGCAGNLQGIGRLVEGRPVQGVFRTSRRFLSICLD
jgi:uncharacterized protein (TIGR03905 family)